MRLDVFLVQNGYVNSREKARYLIKKGGVKLNKKVEQKVAKIVNNDDAVEVLENVKFVSRSGNKLDFAIKHFGLNVYEMVALDIGASSGGFTDCLILSGVKKVYAVDVGTGQLDKKLRNTVRVINIENTDIRNFNPNSVKESLDIIVIDVSFISLKHIIPVLGRFIKKKNTSIIALIKPQFEVGKAALKKGIVRDESIAKTVLADLSVLFQKHGLCVQGVVKSPLKGKEGNQEYLLYALS